MLLVLLKWYLNNISHGIMRTLLRIMFPILNLLLYITLLIMVLTWPVTHYLIKIACILGIWTINCLIPPTDAELMGGCRGGVDPPAPWRRGHRHGVLRLG